MFQIFSPSTRFSTKENRWVHGFTLLFTIHRSHGLTLDKIILSTGRDKFSHGLEIIGLSRVRKLTDRLFDPLFYIDHLLSVNSKKSLIPKSSTKLNAILKQHYWLFWYVREYHDTYEHWM